MGVAKRAKRRDSRVGWNWSASDCSDVKVLVMIVNYRFAKCYHCRKRSEEYTGSLCIIFLNCM